ncbi:MAG: methyltransferase domain-containing protein [Anaerolineaceae bacterium]|nr:methyltransferase domain-containing protein [Anaerolineaceae bacterium]
MAARARLTFLSDLISLLLIGTGITALLLLGWWLFIASEGVYLGRWVVILLYDWFAARYDGIKHYHREYEEMYLAKPVMEAIAPQCDPLVLDVATGTGRMPLALARHENFKGHTIGVDLSRKMLAQAAKNIYPYESATFMWCPAETLPFADNTFDVVTCLEALEFMTNPAEVVKEMVRVLRPGGLLLTSQRINTKLMPGKTWTSGQLQEVLKEAGLVEAKAQIWQVDYRKVWGRKTGMSEPVGAKPLEGILECPWCEKSLMRREGNDWLCDNCKGKAFVGKDGVIELYPLY